jgi:agmatine deiminase
MHSHFDNENEPKRLYDLGLKFMEAKEWGKAEEAFEQSTQCSQKIIDQLIQQSASFDELFARYTDRFRANAACKKAQYQSYLHQKNKPEEYKPFHVEIPHLAKAPILPLSVPGEFDPQEALRLSWPQLEPMAGINTISQFLSMVEAIAPYQFVDVMVNGVEQLMEASWYLRQADINMHSIRFRNVNFGDHWNRDRGDTIGFSSTGERALIKSRFNAWGMGAVSPSLAQYAEEESRVVESIAREYDVEIFTSALTIEGGALEFNGDKILLTTKSVVMQPQRNPGWSQEDIEKEFKRVFDLDKVIFVEEGLPADDSIFRGPQQTETEGEIFYTPLTTNGHIDEVARFVSRDSILLVEVTEQEAEKSGPGSLAARTRERLEKVYKTLSAATNKEGKPFNIIRIPAAEDIFAELKSGDGTFDAALDMKRVDAGHVDQPVFDDETRAKGAMFVAAISYANFVITNNVVLVAKYWEPGYPEIIREKDERVKTIIQNCFPSRKVVQIKDTVYIGLGGGGMHCISKHISAVAQHHATVFGATHSNHTENNIATYQPRLC